LEDHRHSLKSDPDFAGQLAQRCEAGYSAEQRIKAFVPEADNCELVCSYARKLSLRYPDAESQPALFGKLLGVKDVFLTENLPTRAGSWLPRSVFNGKASIPVAKLTNAGAIVLAKTACSEFSYYHKLQTVNPLNMERSPGGSSSGSAAAVAAGLCDLALGSQTRAGISMPAAFCGVYGFNPSSGRISRQGLISFSPTLEQPGLFSRELESLRCAAQILLNKDSASPEQGLQPVLGIPAQNYLSQASSEVLDHFEFLLGQLLAAGFQLKQTNIFSNYLQINGMHHDLHAAEFTQQHIPLYAPYHHLYSLASREFYETGMKVPTERLYQARELQQELREGVWQEMRNLGVNLIISPSTGVLPPLLNSEPASGVLSLPFSFCGLPTLNLPVFSHPTGLPFGLQLSSAWGGTSFCWTVLASLPSYCNRNTDFTDRMDFIQYIPIPPLNS